MHNKIRFRIFALIISLIFAGLFFLKSSNAVNSIERNAAKLTLSVVAKDFKILIGSKIFKEGFEEKLQQKSFSAAGNNYFFVAPDDLIEGMLYFETKDSTSRQIWIDLFISEVNAYKKARELKKFDDFSAKVNEIIQSKKLEKNQLAVVEADLLLKRASISAADDVIVFHSFNEKYSHKSRNGLYLNTFFVFLIIALALDLANKGFEKWKK